MIIYECVCRQYLKHNKPIAMGKSILKEFIVYYCTSSIIHEHFLLIKIYLVE